MTPDLLSLDAEVRQRLKLLLEQQSAVCAGQLVIVGLDAIKEKLGDGWERYRDRVHNQFDKVVETTLAPSEVSLKISEDKYVVVFYDRDQAASRVVCEKILSQVHDTFLGSPDLRGLTLDSVVMALDPESFAKSMGLELDGEAAASLPQDAAPATPVAKPAAARIKQQTGSFDVSTQDVWYLPIWDLENHLIYNYTPTIIRTLGRRRVAGYRVLEDARNPKQIRALDLHLTDRAVADLTAVCKPDPNVLLVVPVSYETLDNNDSRSRLHRSWMKVPKAMRQRVIFLLCGLTPGRPPWLVYEFAAMLGQLGRAVFTQIDARWDNLGRLADLPIRGVMVSVDQDFRPHDRIATDLIRIQAFCQNKRMPMGVSGVYNLDLATAARNAGVKFLSGHYLLGAVDKPQSRLRVDWMDICRLMANDPAIEAAAKAVSHR